MNAIQKAQQFEIPEAVLTDTDFKFAAAGAAGINKIIKAVEKQRTDKTKPLLYAKRKIDGEYKPIVDTLKSMVTDVKEKIAVYYHLKEEEQKLLEEKAIKENPEDSEIIVDDTVHELRHNKLSTVNVNKKAVYRIKDPDLCGIVEIKQMKMIEYLKTNDLPEYIEKYYKDSVIIRGK